LHEVPRREGKKNAQVGIPCVSRDLHHGGGCDATVCDWVAPPSKPGTPGAGGSGGLSLPRPRRQGDAHDGRLRPHRRRGRDAVLQSVLTSTRIATPTRGAGPAGVALVAGLPLQLARCEQWLGASQAERTRALDSLHAVVGGPTPFGQATALTRDQAQRLFDRTCSDPVGALLPAVQALHARGRLPLARRSLRRLSPADRPGRMVRPTCSDAFADR
jgi:hypothetical protein